MKALAIGGNKTLVSPLISISLADVGGVASDECKSQGALSFSCREINARLSLSRRLCLG